MRRIFITIVLTVIGVLPGLSQEEKEGYLNTDEQNSQWISDFQNKDLVAKIESLKQRFIADQDVYYMIQNPHGNSPLKEGYEKMTFARPVCIIDSPDSKQLILPGNPSDELVREIIAILIPENVAAIEFKDDIKAQAIYGARARHGVVTITFPNTDHLRKLKEVIR